MRTFRDECAIVVCTNRETAPHQHTTTIVHNSTGLKVIGEGDNPKNIEESLLDSLQSLVYTEPHHASTRALS